MIDLRVAKTYVWHGERCFFVSTVERDPSCEGSRYNETLVWDFDWKNNRRGEWIGQFEGPKGSIKRHWLVVESLFKNGDLKALEDK